MNTVGKFIRVAAVGVVPMFCALSVTARDIEVGDSTTDVVQELGEPTGYIKSGAFEMYLYDRGRVQFRSGKVTAVDLVSAEQAKAQREERERQREAQILFEKAQRVAQTQIEKEQREARSTEGEAEKLAKLQDPAFAALPAGEQAAFWAQFRARYPEVDVATVYREALQRQERELEQTRMEQRVAELERRVQEAEKRARDAEAAAENARWAWPSVSYANPPVFVPYPYWYDYRPATPSPPRPEGRASDVRAPSWVKPIHSKPIPAKSLDASETNRHFRAFP